MKKVSFPFLLKLVTLFCMVALVMPTAAQAQTQERQHRAGIQPALPVLNRLCAHTALA